MKKAIVFMFVCLFMFAAAASAEVETKFYGFQWLRYDYLITGSINDATVDTNSFYVPRTYLRWKLKDAELGYEANLTIDVNNTKGGQGVTDTAVAGSIDWGVWLKHGYIVLNKVPVLQDIGASVKIGVQPVYFGVIDTWGSPIVERSIEDRRSLMSAADNGIAITGKIPADWGAYELAVYNGSGYKNLELNSEKAYLASILVTPVKEAYARVSYYRTQLNATNKPAINYNVADGVIGLKIGDFDGFFEYVLKNSDKDKTSGKSGTGEGFTAYVNYNIMKELSLLARFDKWNPDTRKTADEMHTYIAGINYKIAGDAILLQVNYQLDTPNYRKPAIQNQHLFITQIKWSW